MENYTDNHTVEVHIYDLTQGMARVMSQMILGKLTNQNGLINNESINKNVRFI